MSESFALVSDVVLNKKKAVVTIYVIVQDNKSITEGGFITDTNGIAVANYHVISSAITDKKSSILVRAYRGAYYLVGDILAFDEERDLAILKLDASELPVTMLPVK